MERVRALTVAPGPPGRYWCLSVCRLCSQALGFLPRAAGFAKLRDRSSSDSPGQLPYSMSRLASLGVRVPSLHADREVMTPLLLQGTPTPGQSQKWAEERVPPLSSLHLYHLPLLTAKIQASRLGTARAQQ